MSQPDHSSAPAADAGVLLDFSPGLVTVKRPASLFTAQCHLIGDVPQRIATSTFQPWDFSVQEEAS